MLPCLVPVFVMLSFFASTANSLLTAHFCIALKYPDARGMWRGRGLEKAKCSAHVLYNALLRTCKIVTKFSKSCANLPPMQAHSLNYSTVTVSSDWCIEDMFLEVHSTLPNPVTSLYRAPSGDVAMVNMVLMCTETHNAWSRARGRMYMPNVQSMYTCMRFTLHSELRAYPRYGHPPRRRCPDKGGLSVLVYCSSLMLDM